MVGPALGAIAGGLDGDELIVVDNGAEDGTPEAVRESAPRATWSRPVDLGFAAGSIVARPHSGELLLLLNPDAVVATGFRERNPRRRSRRAGDGPRGRAW